MEAQFDYQSFDHERVQRLYLSMISVEPTPGTFKNTLFWMDGAYSCRRPNLVSLRGRRVSLAVTVTAMADGLDALRSDEIAAVVQEPHGSQRELEAGHLSAVLPSQIPTTKSVTKA